jgi:hypothetical protein
MMTSKEIAARTFTPEIAANEMAGRFLNAAHEATHKAESIREDLMQTISWLRKELDYALTTLRQGGAVNSLGICQNAAHNIDRMCGELSAVSQIAGLVQYDAQRVGLLPE